MAIVFWDRSLETGVGIIDTQHKQLFDTINRLHDKLSDPAAGRASFLATLDRMQQYAKFHFAEEERLMEAAGFTGLDAHRLEHDAFRAKTDAMKKEAEQGDFRGLLTESLGFLLTWLIQHVRLEDRKYIPYLQLDAPRGKG